MAKNKEIIEEILIMAKSLIVAREKNQTEKFEGYLMGLVTMGLVEYKHTHNLMHCFEMQVQKFEVQRRPRIIKAVKAA